MGCYGLSVAIAVLQTFNFLVVSLLSGSSAFTGFSEVRIQSIISDKAICHERRVQTRLRINRQAQGTDLASLQTPHTRKHIPLTSAASSSSTKRNLAAMCQLQNVQSNDTHATVGHVDNEYTKTRTNILKYIHAHSNSQANLSFSTCCCIRTAISCLFVFTRSCSTLLAALSTSATYVQ